MMKRLLLGSGGLRTAERLQAWKTEVDDFLGSSKKILFIPYAIADHDYYVTRINEIDFHQGRTARGIHTFASTQKAIEDADVISVGGGNSFRLLAELQRQDLLSIIREKVLAGTPYVGVSAGSNLACPTLKTTNDMPIVCPANLNALGLISFQINPHFFPGVIHYYDENGSLEPYAGETREDRIREFHEMNQVPVLGLWEGSILRVENSVHMLKGVNKARLFSKNAPSKDFQPQQIIEGVY